MSYFDIHDASRRLSAVGYVPAWLDINGGYINAVRADSTINMHAADNVVVKMQGKDRSGPPVVALIATSLQQALDFMAAHTPMDYRSAGYLAAADFEETVINGIREEYDDTTISLSSNCREYHLKHVRKTAGFEPGVDLYRFDLNGNRR